MRLSLEVDDAHAWARLDAFLAAHMHWRSRRWLAARVAAGAVRVNGRAAKKSQRLAAGDRIELLGSEPTAAPPDLGALPLSILFEDDELVVVDKPAQLPVHPASTCLHVNLLARLQHRYRHELPDPRAQPSIIHRLDRNTTGVIAIARRREVVPFYMAQFERRRARKHYLALVCGAPPEHGRIELPLAADPARPVTTCPLGKPARTDFRVRARARDHALVEIELHTGRKHQIRVHFAAAGFPVAFDDLYGDLSEAASWPVGIGPQLHAWRLALDHRDGRRLELEAPMPATMRELWREITDSCGPHHTGYTAGP